MKKILSFIFACVVICAFVGCRSTKTVIDIQTDTLRHTRTESVAVQHVSNINDVIEHWNTETRVITLSVMGDTIRDVQRIYIRDNSSRTSVDTMSYTSSKTDTVLHTNTKYIRYTVEKKPSLWESFKSNYFWLVSVLALIAFGLLFLVTRNRS